MKWFSYLPFLDEHTYERYLPTAFDESMTLLQKVNKVINGLNTVIQAVNTTFDEVDKQTEKIESVRDDFEVLKTWLENEGLQERTVWVLNEWFDSGKLATIIAEEVFNMKVDKTTFEQFVTDQQTELADIQTALTDQQETFQQFTTDTEAELADIQTSLTDQQETFQQFTADTQTELGDIRTTLTDTTEKTEQAEKTLSYFVNVTDFGATGDGVTDDTQAIQNAIDSVAGLRHATVLFPPTPDAHYKVSSLIIPANTHLLRFEGIGYSRIYFTDLVGFHVRSEMFTVENMVIQGTHADTLHEGVMFQDARDYNRLDFDLKLVNCTLSYVSKLVITKGRGVGIYNCNMNDITHHIILIGVLPKALVEVGTQDIQQYETGYRGFVVTGCRFHYCTAIVFDNSADHLKVAQGFFFNGNHIEGALAYFNGFCRDGVFTNNIQYHGYTNRSSLFNFTGVDNVLIDVNISGMTLAKHGHTKRYARLIEANGYVENLRVVGNIANFERNIFTFYGGGRNIHIAVNVTDFVASEGYQPHYVAFGTGAFSYEGLYIGGQVHINTTSDVIYKTDLLPTFNAYRVDTLVTGNFRDLHNLAFTGV